MSKNNLILSASILLATIYNGIFWQQLFYTYGTSEIFHFNSIIPILFIAVLLFLMFALILSLFSFGKFLKFALAFIFTMSSVLNYFSYSYSTIFDRTMIQNILETNVQESLGLLNFKFFIFIFFGGFLPSLIIFKYEKIVPEKTRKYFLRIVMLVIFIILTSCIAFLSSSSFFSSFFREHKILRSYIIPIQFIYSTSSFITKKSLSSKPTTLTRLGENPKTDPLDKDRDLIIIVIGETARADHFSLNGYSKKTNPLLEKEDVISFKNFYSSGTSTAFSVPCMFSNLTQKYCDSDKIRESENLLDLIKRTGGNILWRDNNSDSKGVATRIQYQDFKSNKLNPICNPECRDEGMLYGLQEYIDSNKNGDIIIILHQMGSHGPAYFERYPSQFEKFRPTCMTNELKDCSSASLNNTYDNTILYTDYFLSKTIQLLKDNSKNFETMMVYMSDHGESLGEKGLYLHGMPYMFAPDVQVHIPAVFWLDEKFSKEKSLLRSRVDQKFTHDNFFHTILGLLEITNEVYNSKLDIFNRNATKQ